MKGECVEWRIAWLQQSLFDSPVAFVTLYREQCRAFSQSSGRHALTNFLKVAFQLFQLCYSTVIKRVLVATAYG